MEEIDIAFKYTEKQVKHLYHFGIFPTANAKYYLIFFTVIIFGATSLFVFLSTSLSSHLGIVYPILKIVLGICAVIWFFVLFSIFVSFFITPIMAFKKSPAYQGLFKVKLNNQGMTFLQEIKENDEPKITNGFMNWADFRQKAESQDFIILYKGKIGNALPKSAFKSQAELTSFKEFLDGRVDIEPKTFNRKSLWGNLSIE
ncbi:hypothetical protein EZJ43_13275 [Pedobacter changchengzhani]|uniref:YcxB family protein n=1 Tax=Pedobacter changchengzhani TaxID=2529274 RepID=A0A4R5MIX4_9SPHI|nr:YcxB family protein [Pedobacter changchengzhani]TDG35587.1 hypothetical protein EZJ43_13275 [Pedobacter changchengzhani]